MKETKVMPQKVCLNHDKGLQVLHCTGGHRSINFGSHAKLSVTNYENECPPKMSASSDGC